MGYEKQNFVEGQILTAEHLNHMEDGILVTDKISSEVDELKGNIINIITDPDNYPLSESEPTILAIELGGLSRTDGSETERTDSIRTVDYIPVVAGQNYILSNSGDYLICILCYDSSKNFLTNWNGSYSYKFNESGSIIKIPQNAAYIRFYCSKSSDTSVEYTIINENESSNHAEFVKQYFKNHGYAIYGDNIDDETMHKLVIKALGMDENTYNITEVKAPESNPQEATICLMNWGNGKKQFVDFSSMVYDENNPTVELVCQTRGEKKLPEFSIRYNNGNGAGRVKKFVVKPDAIPMEMTADGLVVRRNNNYDNNATSDELVTVNLADLYDDTISLKSDIVNLTNGILFGENTSVNVLGTFDSGGLTNNTFNPNQKYRCSSTDIVYSKNPIKCHVSSGFRFGWVITNVDGSEFVGWKGWYTSDVVIPQGIYFKFQIARVIEDTTEISNVSEFTSSITISTQFERLNDVISDVEELKLYSDVLIEQGALYSGLESASDKFVRTAKIIKGEKILINNTTDFSLVIVAYYYNNNGVFVEASPGILVNVGDSFVFSPSSNNYRLRIGKGGETVITPSDVNGVLKSVSSLSYTSYDREKSRQLSLQYKDIMIGFAHRGASNLAPENTASAFKLASKLGYIAVETDFRFTSDGVPVIIHDATVDRTSNLSGDVGSMTLEQLKTGDFGSWFSSDFSGEKILTFDECIKLCKQLGLIVVMEQKQWLESDRIKQVCDIVKKYDMCESVWWVGDTVSIIVQFARNIPNATIGYVVDDIPPEYEAKLDALKSASDRVYISMRNTKITDEKANTLMNKGIKLYAWTIDSDTEIINLHPYVSGVFSNNLNAAVVLNDNI